MWDHWCDININVSESLYTSIDILVFMETLWSTGRYFKNVHTKSSSYKTILRISKNLSFARFIITLQITFYILRRGRRRSGYELRTKLQIKNDEIYICLLLI